MSNNINNFNFAGPQCTLPLRLSPERISFEDKLVAYQGTIVQQDCTCTHVYAIPMQQRDSLHHILAMIKHMQREYQDAPQIFGFTQQENYLVVEQDEAMTTILQIVAAAA